MFTSFSATLAEAWLADSETSEDRLAIDDVSEPCSDSANFEDASVTFDWATEARLEGASKIDCDRGFSELPIKASEA